MRNSRKRKADKLSVIKPSLKRCKVKISNADLDLIKISSSVKIDEFSRGLEIAIDKTIVNRYLDCKDSLRDRLEPDSNSTTTTCRSKKNKSHTNNLEQITLDSVQSDKNISGVPDIVVKIETAADTNDDLCANDRSIFDSSLIKQELPDETINMKSSNVSEIDMLAFDHTESTEHQPNNFSIKNEDEFSHTIESIKIEPTDSSFNCNDFLNDDFTVDEEFKSEDFVVDLSCRTSNDERESETYFEKLENESNATSISQFTARESMINRHYYRCSNCDFKTISKKLINRHIFHNHFDKDGYLPCKKCNKKFKTDKILKFHEKLCGTKLYLTCKFCPKIVSSRFFIRRHLISQHPNDFKLEELDGIMQEIIMTKVRKDKKEMTKVLKEIPLKKKRVRSIFDHNKFIKMFCSKCNVISERGKIVIAIDCHKCSTKLLFQCQMCGKSYDKICAMRSHIKWSCESAEIKLMKNNTVLSNLVHEKKIIVHTKLNPLLDEISQSEESDLSNYECKECIMKNFNVCKHIQYKRAGCRYEKGLAICPKCNAKFKLLQKCMKHQIFCGVQFRYACLFCHYTSKQSDDVKRHLKCTHIDKFDMDKFQDIFDQVKNERNKVKEKYEADYRSSKMFKAAQSNDS